MRDTLNVNPTLALVLMVVSVFGCLAAFCFPSQSSILTAVLALWVWAICEQIRYRIAVADFVQVYDRAEKDIRDLLASPMYRVLLPGAAPNFAILAGYAHCLPRMAIEQRVLRGVAWASAFAVVACGVMAFTAPYQHMIRQDNVSVWWQGVAAVLPGAYLFATVGHPRQTKLRDPEAVFELFQQLVAKLSDPEDGFKAGLATLVLQGVDIGYEAVKTRITKAINPAAEPAL